jgi:hypothetical protein
MVLLDCSLFFSRKKEERRKRRKRGKEMKRIKKSEIQ